MSVNPHSLVQNTTTAGSTSWPDTISLDPNVPLDPKFRYLGISREMLQSSLHISHGYYGVLHEKHYYVFGVKVHGKGSRKSRVYKCYARVDDLSERDAKSVLREALFALNATPDEFGQLNISEEQFAVNMYIMGRFMDPDAHDFYVSDIGNLMTKRHMLRFHVLKSSRKHPTPDYYINRIVYVGPRFRPDIGPLTIVINGAEVQKPAGNWKVVARVFKIPHEKVLRVERYLESGYYAVEHEEKHYIFQRKFTAQPPAVVVNYIVKLDMSGLLYTQIQKSAEEISALHSDGTTIINKLFGTSANVDAFNEQMKDETTHVLVYVGDITHRFKIYHESLGIGYWQVTSDGLNMELHEGGTIRLLNWAERYKTSRKPTQRH